MRLLSLVAVLLVSGCTTLPFVLSGNGVAIEAFESDFSDVFSGEQVDFTVKIKNIGSQLAKGGKIAFLGLEDWTSSFQRTCTFDALIAPTPSTEGQSFLCSIQFIAPEVPDLVSVTYHPSARVAYTYSTTTLQHITIASQEEALKIEKGGGSLTTDTATTTQSPIAITTEAQGPIRVFENSLTFPLTITVTNVGGGTVCNQDYNDCDNSILWNTLDITTTMAGTRISDCSQALSLSSGTNTITCDIPVSSLPTSGVVQRTIQVQSEYGYFVDKEITVAVKAKL